MAWWNSLSKLLILRVVFHSYLQLRYSSMASICSVCVVLLRLAGVVCINWDIWLLALVDVLVLLSAVAVALVFDWVLRAGALSLTVGLAYACRLLRILFLVIIWWLSGRSSCTIFGVLSTLRTSVGDTLGTSGVSFVIFLVIRMSVSPNGFILFTLGSEWAMSSSCSTLVCGAGFAGLVMA